MKAVFTHKNKVVASFGKNSQVNYFRVALKRRLARLLTSEETREAPDRDLVQREIQFDRRRTDPMTCIRKKPLRQHSRMPVSVETRRRNDEVGNGRLLGRRGLG